MKIQAPEMDEVEAQLCEIFGEVEEKENLLPNSQLPVQDAQGSADEEIDVENIQEEGIKGRSIGNDNRTVVVDMLGLDDDITPLDSSPEGMVITSFLKISSAAMDFFRVFSLYEMKFVQPLFCMRMGKYCNWKYCC